MPQRPRLSLSTSLPFGFLAIALSAPLNSQTQTSDVKEPTVFKANVRTVVVNVVVTDKNGKPARGLHQEDFRVAEDSHPQKITSFEEHSALLQTVTSLPALPPNIFTNVPRLTPADSYTVLVFDALNSELRDQVYVRREMFKYLENPAPGRRMAIFALGSRLHLIQGFTDDPAVLASVLKNLKSGAAPQRSAVLQSREQIAVDQQTVVLISEKDPGAAKVLKQFLDESAASQTSLRVDMTLEAFQDLANYLAGIPGRKNVVWFSSAFPSTLFGGHDQSTPDPLIDPFALERDYGDKVRKTDALLAEAQVAVYPVAVEGTATDLKYDADVHLLPSLGQTPKPAGIAPDAILLRNANHTTMDEIARDTGGQAFYNTNGLSEALSQVVDRDSYYYTLSYTPNKAASDGRLRRIQVKLAGGSYKLAYRRAYFADDAKADRAAASKLKSDPLAPYMGPGRPASTQIPMALRVQPASTQVIHVAPQPGNSADAIATAGDDPKLLGPLTRYTVDFVIAASGLQLDPAPGGTRHGGIEVTLIVYDQNGRALNWMVRQVNLDMDAARYVAVQANGVNFTLEIDVPKEGVSLRGGVYDHNSNHAGSLEIPLASVVTPPAQRAALPR